MFNTIFISDLPKILVIRAGGDKSYNEVNPLHHHEFLL